MTNQAIWVVNQVINQLLDLFITKIISKQINNLVPKNVQFYTHKTYQGLLALSNCQQKKLNDEYQQDELPRITPIQKMINKHLYTVNVQQVKGSINAHYPVQTEIIQENKQSRQIQNSQNYEPITKFISQEQARQEQQFHAIRQKLQFIRKTKQNEQKQQLEKIRNKKKSKIFFGLPTSGFTYNFEGQLIKKDQHHKKMIKRSLISQIKKMEKLDQFRYEKINSSEIGLQNSQNKSFRNSSVKFYNNQNQRQVTHLPFINLTENTKITQEHFGTKGVKILQRQSSQRNQISTFRHHLEKEKNKRMQNLLQNSQNQDDYSLNSQQNNSNNTYGKSIILKQSRNMAKYMQKLYGKKDNKYEQKINKSMNFDKLEVPSNKFIHKFYRYNFDQMRQKIGGSTYLSPILKKI